MKCGSAKFAFAVGLAVVALRVQQAACDSSEPQETPALGHPAVFPATVLSGGGESGASQCVDVRNSPIGRHALTEMDNGIRGRLKDDIIPTLSRSFQRRRCTLGKCKENPAFFCAEMISINNASVSGLYWVRISNGSTVQVYCDFDEHPICNSSTGQQNTGWMRVAYLNMSDPTHNCPFNLRLSDPADVRGLRLCHKRLRGCTSVFFSTLGFAYRNVRGRVKAFQYGEPDAFKPFHRDQQRSLEDTYVDGISVTYGWAPRHHIWTFAIAQDATQSSYEACPCTVSDSRFGGTIPPFIGDDYFCDTGSANEVQYNYYLDDPLWDGEGCSARSTCCEWRNPPWFCKELPELTRSDIELRVCSDSDSDNESALIQEIEVFVQ